MKRPLGVFEHTQAFANAHFPFNVVVVLRLSGAPSADTLERAFGLLRGRHPLLGVRIQGPDKAPWFDTEDVPPMPLRQLPRCSDEDWQAVAEEELNSSFDLERGPLVRAAYLGPAEQDRRAELLLVFQHLIMDAASGIGLLRELLERCADLQAGREPPEPELLLYPPVAEDCFTPAMRRGQIGFLLRQLTDELRYRWHSRGKRQPGIFAEGRSRILPMQLSEQVAGALVQRCRRQRVTLNSALCTAMLRVAKRRLYGGGERLLRNFVFANLRPYMDPPLPTDNLGSCFAMMRHTTRVAEDCDFWDLARSLNNQLYQAAKRGEKYHNLLMSWRVITMMLRQNRFRLSHTALGYTGVADLARDYDGMHLHGLHAFVSNFVQGPEYTAQARLFDGRLWWDFVYLDCDMDRDKAESMAREILTDLEEQADDV